jgi:hypothetical protein
MSTTVRELIAQLQNLNPDAKVYVNPTSGYDCECDELQQVRQGHAEIDRYGMHERTPAEAAKSDRVHVAVFIE